MRCTEKDIVFETDCQTHFVIKQQKKSVRNGTYDYYEVCKNGITHATVVATVGCGLENALERAINIAKERAKGPMKMATFGKVY
jgi:hypothetical protein